MDAYFDAARPVLQALQADVVLAGIGIGRQTAAAPMRHALVPSGCANALTGHGIPNSENAEFAANVDYFTGGRLHVYDSCTLTMELKDTGDDVSGPRKP